MTETKIAERIISGTGLLRLPPSESAVRYYSVLVDVIRLPRTRFPSFKYNPPRQRYATMVLVRNNYVIGEEPIDYPNRRFDYLVNEPGQVLIALKCSHKQVLAQLAGSGTPATSNIDTFANLSMMWSELRFVCQEFTAIKVSLYQDLYDQCGDEYREKSPPPPPPPSPPDDTGTPIADISPPYDEDDNVTSKDPQDEYYTPEPPEFPQGNRCTKYLVNTKVRLPSGFLLDTTTKVFGEVTYVGLSEDGLRVYISCYGTWNYSFDSCPNTPTEVTTQTSSVGFLEGSFEYTITEA